MSYAIISIGGKQYRVREGERLLVDRIDAEDGKTFAATVLLVGGDGEPQLAPSDVTVTARVLGQRRGPKIRIGKYRRRTGYRRHTGFRAALTQIEIESIGARRRAPSQEGRARGGREAQGGQAEGREAESTHDEEGQGGRELMAHKKGLGSSKNGRDSQSKRLGVKIFAGQPVKAGNDHRAPARDAVPPGRRHGHRPGRHDLRGARGRGGVPALGREALRQRDGRLTPASR